jgi:hypothetical protein
LKSWFLTLFDAPGGGRLGKGDGGYHAKSNERTGIEKWQNGKLEPVLRPKTRPSAELHKHGEGGEGGEMNKIKKIKKTKKKQINKWQ